MLGNGGKTGSESKVMCRQVRWRYKSEVLRKAITLYLAAREGSRRGLKVGLVEPKTQKLETEIVGL